MKSVIVDTNVIVSALISKSAPYTILHEYVFLKKLRIILSDEILQEYITVLSRGKFAKYPDFIANSELTIAIIENIAIKINPTEKLNIAIDKDDNKFLELAKASSADYLITGNIKDFGLTKFENTEIVSPAEFLITEKQTP